MTLILIYIIILLTFCLLNERCLLRLLLWLQYYKTEKNVSNRWEDCNMKFMLYCFRSAEVQNILVRNFRYSQLTNNSACSWVIRHICGTWDSWKIVEVLKVPNPNRYLCIIVSTMHTLAPFVLFCLTYFLVPKIQKMNHLNDWYCSNNFDSWKHKRIVYREHDKIKRCNKNHFL